MRNRRRLILSDDGAENFWPSFTDLISTVAMILFVLVLLAYIQNLISGKNLDAVKAELSAAMLRLRSSQQEIASSEKKLKVLAAEIEAGQTQLKLSRAQVDQQQTVISDSTHGTHFSRMASARGSPVSWKSCAIRSMPQPCMPIHWFDGGSS